MPKKMGIVFVLTGAVLILSALLLFLNNTAEDVQAGKEAESVMLEVALIIEERKSNKVAAKTDHDPSNPLEIGTNPTDSNSVVEINPSEQSDSVVIEDETMPTVDVSGYSCIGILSIPTLEVTLPVLEDWSYTKLRVAPCRQFGSPNTNDFVIAAHNYKNHFGRLSELTIGDEVTFTDVDGIEYHYELVKLITLDPTAIADVRDSGNSLVLYTCTYGGSNRIAAFFDCIHING